MIREDMLARLIAQESEAGGDLVSLRAIVEEASELGAERMLARLGLTDAHAQDDLVELRELLRAWRDAKRSVWKVLIEWLFRALLALLLIGIAVRGGVTELLK
ncbi:MAG: hypothetical protein JSS36_11655 [Proteobacteria bacterium]|nr:hypothetical protein [Pseudomonadota bacterium]